MSSIDAINAARANQGLPPLRWDPEREQYEADHEPVVRVFNELFDQIGETYRSFAEAVKSSGVFLDEFAAAKRKDTLRREAAAALGRGDRKAHRKALEEIRSIDRRTLP